jgi:hypothetical protein
MFNFDPNDPNLGKQRDIFLLFETSATYSVVTSHFFDLRDKDDLELCRTAFAYELTATYCNTIFTGLNWDIPRKLMTEQRLKEMRQKIIYTEPFRELKTLHQEMRNILKKKYNWALEEAKPLVQDLVE